MDSNYGSLISLLHIHKKPSINYQTHCKQFHDDNQTSESKFQPEFNWDRSIQANLLAGFSWGGPWLLFFTGYLLDNYGVKRCMSVGYGISTIAILSYLFEYILYGILYHTVYYTVPYSILCVLISNVVVHSQFDCSYHSHVLLLNIYKIYSAYNVLISNKYGTQSNGG